MTLYNLFTQKIIVSRLVAVSGDKTTYSTVTAEYCNIQRMSDEKTVEIGGAIGKTFRLYAEENADIEKGDKLVDEDGNEYKVVSVSIPTELGNFVHKEIIINKVK
ncbi:MAG: hypothetical protein ACTSR2_00990 [Candidatus Hodarchaeales archaeon]